jgi:hypothetical protein
VIKKHTYKITKSTVEVYRFRAEGAPYWADVTIDNEAGGISISSDFGNWSFRWGATGDESFKKFLGRVDQHYVAGKFGANKFFRADETIRMYESQTEQCGLTSDEKTAALREIARMQGYIHKEEFMSMVRDMPRIMGMYEGCPELCHDLDPGYKNLWEHIWPLMLETFKVEEALPEPFIYNREDGVIEKAQMVAFTGPLSLDFLKDENNSGKVFATGVINHPTLHTDPVRWIAKVGGAEDWAIYYHNQDQSLSFVQANGNKVTTEGVIRQLVPCTDEAFGRYRM